MSDLIHLSSLRHLGLGIQTQRSAESEEASCTSAECTLELAKAFPNLASVEWTQWSSRGRSKHSRRFALRRHLASSDDKTVSIKSEKLIVQGA